MSAPQTNRRSFLRGSGAAAGSLAALGVRPTAALAHVTAAELPRLKIEGAREVPSVCPYCAVGCGQIVSVKDGRIVNIEGNPDSPINRGTLCPKGAAAFQLTVNPSRLTKVKYRAPGATDWEERPLEWAMERIATLMKAERDRSFVETWSGKDTGGTEIRNKRVNHCPTIASLGGATMDNEWNYVHLKLWRALGLIWLENQARI